MKKILFFLLALPFLSFGQDNNTSPFGLQLKDGDVVFEYIVKAPTVKEEIIFAAANKWIVDSQSIRSMDYLGRHVTDSTKYSKLFVETEDKEIGQIIVSGHTEVKLPSVIPLAEVYIKFSIQIDCQDDKYRIRFYNIRLPQLYGSSVMSPFQTVLFGSADKKRRSGQIERAKKTVSNLNDLFGSIQQNLVNTVDKSSKDVF